MMPLLPFHGPTIPSSVLSEQSVSEIAPSTPVSAQVDTDELAPVTVKCSHRCSKSHVATAIELPLCLEADAGHLLSLGLRSQPSFIASDAQPRVLPLWFILEGRNARAPPVIS